MPLTYSLDLSHEEITFLVSAIPLMARYPEPHEAGLWALLHGEEVSGGPPFRLKMVALWLHAKQLMETKPLATFPVELTVGELWFLDAVTSTLNYSQVRMSSNGTPLLRLVAKVWRLLVDAHSSLVDERYLPQQSVKVSTAPITDDQRNRLAEYDRLTGAGE